jgi:hypothetical protein
MIFYVTTCDGDWDEYGAKNRARQPSHKNSQGGAVMVAAFSQQRAERPEGMPWIHSTLDDAQLTPEGFRVFCHLARKARCDRDARWYAWPSLDDIAEVCFRRSYPNSPVGVLRRKAYDAISELEQRQLLAVQRFKGKGNKYYLLPLEYWQPVLEMPENRNIRKGRRKKADPDLILGGSGQGTLLPDPPRIRLVPTQKPLEAPTDESFEPNSADVPDPPRITKYIYLKNLEKERSVDRFAAAEEGEWTGESSLYPPATSAFQVQSHSAQAPTSGADQGSALAENPPKNAFEASRYHWPCYDEPGSGGSEPAFYAYMLRRIQAYSDRRVRNGNKKIACLEEYTLTVIRQEGARLYQEFEIDAGLRDPVPTTLGSPVALPSDAPMATETWPVRAPADRQAGGSNGSLKPFQGEVASPYELQAEEVQQNRQRWFQTQLANQRFSELKVFLDGLINRGERSHVEQLLQQFPEAGFQIKGKKVWRPLPCTS